MSLIEEVFWLLAVADRQAHAACGSRRSIRNALPKKTDLTCCDLETSIELNVVTRPGISPLYGNVGRSEQGSCHQSEIRSTTKTRSKIRVGPCEHALQAG
jgi:hypothetical protein